jgi:hypothetical protein
MSTKHRLLKASRLIHLYLGVFITPALIFFAFTGFVQTFSLHETTRGSNYKPPAILVKLGQLHKKQTLVVPPRRQPPQASAAAPTPVASIQGTPQQEGGTARHHHDDAAPTISATPPAVPQATPAPKQDGPPPATKNLLPMKLFFALVSIGLFISTVTGLYMSYKYVRNAKAVTAVLIAGIAIPVLLTFV